MHAIIYVVPNYWCVYRCYLMSLMTYYNLPEDFVNL